MLEKVAAVIDSFSKTGITDEIRRALLTIDDKTQPDRLFFHYWYSWFYTKNLPKYCLISNDTTFRWFSLNPEFRIFLKELVLKLVEAPIENLLESFVPPADMPNWRKRLIQEPELIELATARYIAYDAKNKIIYPIPGIRPHDTDDRSSCSSKGRYPIPGIRPHDTEESGEESITENYPIPGIRPHDTEESRNYLKKNKIQ